LKREAAERTVAPIGSSMKRKSTARRKSIRHPNDPAIVHKAIL
jgi:hypothetical protein